MRSRTPRLRSHRLVAMLMSACCVVAAGGCALVLGFEETTVRSTDGEGGTIEGGVDEAGNPIEGGTSRLTTKPASVTLRRGGSVEVTVDIARGSDVTGPVTASLSDLPGGVTATSATIAANATTGTLKLSAIPNATLGSKVIKLSAEGTSLPPAQIPLLVADPAGALDVTFDTDGLVSDGTKGLGGTFFALALATDQKIVAGGAGGPGSPQVPSGWIIRRYAANGAPDTTFNTAANAVGIPVDGQLRAMAIDADGKIVAVGSSSPMAGQLQLTVARFTTAGKLDAAFQGGVIRLPPAESPGGSSGLGVLVQPNGAIVVVGSRKDLVGTESGIITRFKADGTRDTTFNNGTTLAIPNTRFVGVALEGTAIVAVGSTTAGALPSYFAARRTTSGANDPTFGTNGTATFGNTYRANGFARLSDGSLVVVGDVQQGAQGYTAGLASAQGNPKFVRTFANSAGAAFFGVGIQADGRIVAAGHTAVPNGEARVERILADGNKDTSFADGGTMLVEPPGGVANFDVTLFAAAVQADGRILAAGNRSSLGAVVYRLWP